MSGAEKQGREGEGERGRENYSCIMYVYTSTAWMAMATMYNGVAQYVHVCAVCVYTVMPTYHKSILDCITDSSWSRLLWNQCTAL